MNHDQWSWKTTFGGACSSLGKTLMGIGVVPQLGSGVNNDFLTKIAVAGFILDALGTFVSNLFAVDKQALDKSVAKAMNGHTEILLKAPPGSPPV